MKYPVLAGLLLLAVGTHHPAAAQRPARPRPATRPAAATVPLNLTSYGIPLVLMVPAGTKVAKDPTTIIGEGKEVRLLLNGPRVALKVATHTEEPAMALQNFDTSKGMYKSMGYQLEVNEPLALLGKSTNAGYPMAVIWEISVPLPGDKSCSLEMQDSAANLTEADQRAMFALARTAKPTSK